MNTTSSASSTSAAHRRALVLGGGGSAGNAWLIGVLAGLTARGVAVTSADLIVGTSAGSTAAAQISDTDPAELYAAVVDPAGGHGAAAGTLAAGTRVAGTGAAGTGRGTGTAPGRLSFDHLERLRSAIARSTGIDELRRTMGAELAADTSVDPAGWRAIVSSRFRARSWPSDELVITAVDAHTGEPVLFDRDSGVDLVDAVAASCAGGFAYPIGVRRYIDGGYRANADNADLAAAAGRALVLSPLGGRSLHPVEWGTHLADQVARLRAGGTRVETVFPDDAAVAAFGDNMMNPVTRIPAARAGHAQGLRLADRIAAFWG